MHRSFLGPKAFVSREIVAQSPAVSDPYVKQISSNSTTI